MLKLTETLVVGAGGLVFEFLVFFLKVGYYRDILLDFLVFLTNNVLKSLLPSVLGAF